MSKTERYARKLISVYGFVVQKYSCEPTCSFRAKPKGPGIWWNDSCVFYFDDWKDVLFGNNSLNRHIRRIAENNRFLSFKKHASKLIDFKSIEELDVQLTLAGVNSDPDKKEAQL